MTGPARALAAGSLAVALALGGCGVEPSGPPPAPSDPMATDVAQAASTADCPRGSRPARTDAPALGPLFGLQGGANAFDPCVARRLGARVVRVEFPIGTPVRRMRSHVAAYAERGTRVLLLAGFYGAIPSGEQARSVANWGREFGPGGRFWRGRRDRAFAVRHIEFGNETSYSYQGLERNGGDYAERVRDAARALRGRGGNRRVGLLVQADEAGTGQDWIDQMYDAVPALHRYAAGWTIHPYGPSERWEPRLDGLVERTAARGAPDSMPIDVTEWGLATDDGRCLTDNYGWDPCMTYAEAADALRGTVNRMTKRHGGRLRHFIVYHGRDQRRPGQSREREHYFGVTTRTDRGKGVYTRAVRELLAAAPGRAGR